MFPVTYELNLYNYTYLEEIQSLKGQAARTGKNYRSMANIPSQMQIKSYALDLLSHDIFSLTFSRDPLGSVAQTTNLRFMAISGKYRLLLGLPVHYQWKTNSIFGPK